MFAWLASPEMWIALGTLTALEIVLGIDNIILSPFLWVDCPRISARSRAEWVSVSP